MKWNEMDILLYKNKNKNKFTSICITSIVTFFYWSEDDVTIYNLKSIISCPVRYLKGHNNTCYTYRY